MMKKRPLTSLSDYIDLVMRRKLWIVVPALLVPMIVFVVGRRLPKVYKSETLILVAPQKVPTDYVKPTVNGDVSDRLQTLSQQILSRTRLESVIDELGLYPNSKSTKDQLVERMRADITVEIVADPRPERRSVGAFHISYLANDPATAQKVVQRLASLFISENLKAREMQAVGTTQFIENALQDTKDRLAKQEDAIRHFKAQNMGSLPEQEQANLTVLNQLQGMLQATNDEIGRADQQRVYLESLISASEKTAPVGSSIEKKIEDTRAQLAAAEQMYTPQYPDVIRLKRDLAALQSQAGGTHDAQPADPNRSQLAAIKGEIARKKQKQQQIEQQIQGIEGRIAMLPSVEMQFADLNRDYETTKAQYKTLLEKKDSSVLAADMEKRSEGEQFQVLDPANYPRTPIKPDLMQIDLLGVLAGLGIGFGAAFLRHMQDGAIHSQADVEYYLNTPVLAQIPEIKPASAAAA